MIMKTLLSLFISLMCLSGVQSAEQLTQSDPAVIKPGSSHTLTCTASGFTFSSYWMGWVRQLPSGQLQWLCTIDNTGGRTYYNDALKGRLKISRDNNNNRLTLKMDNTNTDDTAVYYCARSVGARAFDVWGPGSFLTVTSASPSAPSLYPLISCGKSESQGASTAIACLAKGFLPDSIEFSWADRSNNSYTNGFMKFNSVLQNGGTYAASTQVKVPPGSLESGGSYYCTAKHPQNTVTKAVHLPRVVSRSPTVTIHAPTKEDIDFNGNATIVCIAGGFYPKDIEVTWKKNYQNSSEAVTKETVSDGNGGFVITSFITVSRKDWDADIPFSCIVTHSSSKFYEMKNISKSAVCEPSNVEAGPIKVTTVGPRFETIYFENSAPLTCTISNMDSTDGLDVTWYAEGKEINNTVLEDEVYDSSTQKRSVNAIATVCPDDWKKKYFECKVKHSELAEIKVVGLKKTNVDNEKPPTVYLYPPHSDELAKKESATLTCVIRGFSPADIFVKWINKSGINVSEHAVATQVLEEKPGGKTYFMVSILTIQTHEWNSGNAYTCLVGHEKLPFNTIQKTIDKTAGKPTNVNVSLVMSDSC